MAENSADNNPLPDDWILDEAAVWCMKLTAGEITEDAPDFRAWLEASEDHEEAMARARITWGLLGDHAKSPELTKARSDALARTTEAASRRWRPLSTKNNAARFSFGARTKALAAAIALALTAGPLAMMYFSPEDPSAARNAAQVYATDVAETRVITLPDNSRISLDAATRVSVAYTASGRDIALLKGQAHFDVAKDPTRPFRVTAGDQTVVAIGTAFNIEMVDDEVRVTLLEGEVIVTGADEAAQTLKTPADKHSVAPERKIAPSLKLTAGQQLLATDDAAPRIETAPNIEKTTAWRQGKVFLEDDALSVAVARMNRYSRIRLLVADDSLNAISIGGVFNAGDTDGFIEALEAAFPIEARRMSSSRIELHARG